MNFLLPAQRQPSLSDFEPSNHLWVSPPITPLQVQFLQKKIINTEKKEREEDNDGWHSVCHLLRSFHGLEVRVIQFYQCPESEFRPRPPKVSQQPMEQEPPDTITMGHMALPCQSIKSLQTVGTCSRSLVKQHLKRLSIVCTKRIFLAPSSRYPLVTTKNPSDNFIYFLFIFFKKKKIQIYANGEPDPTGYPNGTDW